MDYAVQIPKNGRSQVYILNQAAGPVKTNNVADPVLIFKNNKKAGNYIPY